MIPRGELPAAEQLRDVLAVQEKLSAKYSPAMSLCARRSPRRLLEIIRGQVPAASHSVSGTPSMLGRVPTGRSR